MKTTSNATALIFDLFFSLVFMPLLALFGPMRYWWSVSAWLTVMVILYLYGCYYLAKYLNLPRLILSRSYVRLAVYALLSVVLTYSVTLYPLPEVDFIIPSMSEYQTRVRNYNMAMGLWLMYSLVICYSLTVSFVKELYERRLMQNIAENQRNKAELAVFKAQISPHFLFNTLNSIYGLVVGTSRRAEDAFVKFTEILRYTYVTIDNESVALSDELEYIRNYIDLQMIRLDGHTKVSWENDVDDPDVKIPPMIFMTFVENAFKYGSSSTRESHIHIRLSLRDGLLLFTTENMVLRHRGEFCREMPVGLENCRNRLAVLFPGKHFLLTKEEDSIFKVTLKIDIR